MEKTLHITQVEEAKGTIPDLITFGDVYMFKPLCTASSNEEDWMKSTKAMEIEGLGCVVQVTTKQGNNIAQALTFVPGATIVADKKNNGRKLVSDSLTERQKIRVKESE